MLATMTMMPILLFKGLYQQDVYRPSRNTGLFCLKLLAATVLMGGLLAYLSPDLPQWGAWSMGKASLELTLLLCLGGALYGIVLLALGIRPRHLRADQQ